MRDFTLGTYKLLLAHLQDSGRNFYTLEDICKDKPQDSYVVLRHDVDRKPYNALRMAKLENAKGIRSTYYFRITRKVFDPECIRNISSLGHEVGYHFEDLSSLHGDIDEAVDSFKRNIEKFRQIVPVSTVSMHGKPLSRFDNKELMKRIDFGELGLLCEPYSIVEKLDLRYFTDVGRKWNNDSVNLRDKVTGQKGLSLRTTFDVINALGDELKDENLMLSIHPERWEDGMLPWTKNVVWQSVKNAGKYLLIKMRHDS